MIVPSQWFGTMIEYDPSAAVTVDPAPLSPITSTPSTPVPSAVATTPLITCVGGAASVSADRQTHTVKMKMPRTPV
ncbi:MAG: hypothetical protein ACYS8S_02545, partial [Planctomycetota bacterium]